MSEDVVWINKQLERQFGKSPDGRPKYRVVWSNSQLEKRRTHYSATGLFLGEWQTEVREFPKYSYIKDRFVLEMFLPSHDNEELVTKTTYEPLYVFQDSKQVALSPLYRVCKYVIEDIQEKLTIAARPLEQAAIRNEIERSEKIKEDKDISDIKEYLEDAGSSVIGSHLSTGSGIINPYDSSLEN
jgi:hypothetical protein